MDQALSWPTSRYQALFFMYPNGSIIVYLLLALEPITGLEITFELPLQH